MKKVGREKVELDCGASAILWGQSFRAHGGISPDRGRTKGEMWGVSQWHRSIQVCVGVVQGWEDCTVITFDCFGWIIQVTTLAGMGESLCLKVHEYCRGSNGRQW